MKESEWLGSLKTVAAELEIPYRQAVFVFFAEDFLRRAGKLKKEPHPELRGGLLTYAYTGMIARPFGEIEWNFAGISIMQTVAEILRQPGESGVQTSDLIQLTPDQVQYIAHLGDVSLPIRITAVSAATHSEELYELPVLIDGSSAPVAALPQIEDEVCRRLTDVAWQLPLAGRMDALFDLYFWSLQFDFTGEELQPVMANQLAATPLSSENLQAVFDLRKDSTLERRWRAFIKYAGIKPDFRDACERVERFLKPIWHAVFTETRWTKSWNAAAARWEENETYLY